MEFSVLLCTSYLSSQLNYMLVEEEVLSVQKCL